MTAERPSADTRYSINPWMQDMPIQAKKPAYNSYDDEVRYLSLVEDLTMPAEQIRQIRPRVGNQPFPPRSGYEQHQMTIMEVLSVGPTALLMKDTPTRQESGQPGYGGPALGAW